MPLFCCMSVLTVTTPFNIELEFKVAPFHKRLLAWMIDLLIIYVYIFLMERYVITPLSFFEKFGVIVSILFLAIPAYSYHLICEVLMHGESIGKMALGIKVMDIQGNEASISQYLLRWSFRIVDMVITLGAGAVLSSALSKNNQRIGDIVAGTVVIDRRARTSINETIYLEIEEEAYQPVFSEVMKLSDRDINGIRNLLDTRSNSRDTELYMLQVATKIKEVLNIESNLEPKSFLSQLLADYNYYTRL